MFHWGPDLWLGCSHDNHEAEDLRYKIQRLRNAAALRRSQQETEDRRIVELAAENEQLKLLVHSLMRLLVEKSILTEQQVQQINSDMESLSLKAQADHEELGSGDLGAIAAAARVSTL
jgi:hypothetical protein